MTKNTYEYNIFNCHIKSCNKITPNWFEFKLFFALKTIICSYVTSDSILKKRLLKLNFFDLKTIICTYHL